MGLGGAHLLQLGQHPHGLRESEIAHKRRIRVGRYQSDLHEIAGIGVVRRPPDKEAETPASLHQRPFSAHGSGLCRLKEKALALECEVDMTLSSRLPRDATG